MTGADFANWRRQMRINKSAAARELGISRNTIDAYEGSPEKDVPRLTALACAALWKRLEPWNILAFRD